MRPLFAAKHLAYHLALEAKRVGDPLVCGGPTAAANLAHNLVCDLVPMMALSFRLPLRDQIRHVRGAGIPSQIVKAVIPGVPVVVASLASSRAWASERRENQTVNVGRLVGVSGERKHNNLTPKAVVRTWAQGSPCVAVSPLVFETGQDAPVCAGGVSGESGDGRVSNLSAIFGERGECVCSHVSDYTTHGPECEA